MQDFNQALYHYEQNWGLFLKRWEKWILGRQRFFSLSLFPIWAVLVAGDQATQEKWVAVAGMEKRAQNIQF